MSMKKLRMSAARWTVGISPSNKDWKHGVVNDAGGLTPEDKSGIIKDDYRNGGATTIQEVLLSASNHANSVSLNGVKNIVLSMR